MTQRILSSIITHLMVSHGWGWRKALTHRPPCWLRIVQEPAAQGFHQKTCPEAFRLLKKTKSYLVLQIRWCFQCSGKSETMANFLRQSIYIYQYLCLYQMLKISMFSSQGWSDLPSITVPMLYLAGHETVKPVLTVFKCDVHWVQSVCCVKFTSLRTGDLVLDNVTKLFQVNPLGNLWKRDLDWLTQYLTVISAGSKISSQLSEFSELGNGGLVYGLCNTTMDFC